MKNEVREALDRIPIMKFYEPYSPELYNNGGIANIVTGYYGYRLLNESGKPYLNYVIWDVEDNHGTLIKHRIAIFDYDFVKYCPGKFYLSLDKYYKKRIKPYMYLLLNLPKY